ncbi:hypothetical protein T484DRAFT_1798717 [Baffinella frigidus]|nr:hypothetical protein T484DRAFT_1798717 [Cryptophyta sp. CCMP2293]
MAQILSKEPTQAPLISEARREGAALLTPGKALAVLFSGSDADVRAACAASARASASGIRASPGAIPSALENVLAHVRQGEVGEVADSPTMSIVRSCLHDLLASPDETAARRMPRAMHIFLALSADPAAWRSTLRILASVLEDMSKVDVSSPLAWYLALTADPAAWRSTLRILASVLEDDDKRLRLAAVGVLREACRDKSYNGSSAKSDRAQ